MSNWRLDKALEGSEVFLNGRKEVSLRFVSNEELMYFHDKLAKKQIVAISDTPKLQNSERQPPRIGYYPEASLQLNMDAFTETRYFVRIDAPYNTGLTANQCREAAHILNQLGEYLEWKEDLKKKKLNPQSE